MLSDFHFKRFCFLDWVLTFTHKQISSECDVACEQYHCSKCYKNTVMNFYSVALSCMEPPIIMELRASLSQSNSALSKLTVTAVLTLKRTQQLIASSTKACDELNPGELTPNYI